MLFHKNMADTVTALPVDQGTGESAGHPDTEFNSEDEEESGTLKDFREPLG